MERDQNSSIQQKYDIALRGIYDELYELNVTENTYRIVYHVEGKYVTPPDEGKLNEGIAQVSQEMICPEDRDRFLEFFNLDHIRSAFAMGQESLLTEVRKLWEDGKYHWASLTLVPLESAWEVYLCFIMDVDAKKSSEELRRQNQELRLRQMDEERYRIIVEQTGAIVLDFNFENAEFYVSPRMAMFACSTLDPLSLLNSEEEAVHPQDKPAVKGMRDRFAEAIKQKRRADTVSTQSVVRLKKTDGSYLYCRIVTALKLGPSGERQRIICTISDIDESVRNEQVLKYRAEYDQLTGIYNKIAFEEHGRELLERYPDVKYAIFWLDVNRFKVINDLYGYEEGDRLLCFIAGTLTEMTKGRGICGHANGDIFSMMVSFANEEELKDMAVELTEKLGMFSSSYRAVPSIGICIADERERPVHMLCDYAGLAMKTVKGNIVRTFAFYDEGMRAAQIEEKTIENEMEAALLHGEFIPYLQPKYEIRTGKIIGAEALVRWQHPVRGLLSPSKFFPMFERDGFIVKVDDYMWEQAFRLIRRWLDMGMEPVPISVNVSRMHAYDPNIYDRFLELSKTYGVEGRYIELELTESAFVDNTDCLFDNMQRIRQKGFKCSMDDFGTGYSSLNMLQNMPVDYIKLDGGFLNEKVMTEKGRTVVRAMIHMIHEIGMKVVAEGVETDWQVKLLQDTSCTGAQGYYYAKPMAPEDFEELYRKQLGE